MDALLIILAIVAVIATLEAASIQFGAESRDGFGGEGRDGFVDAYAGAGLQGRLNR